MDDLSTIEIERVRSQYDLHKAKKEPYTINVGGKFFTFYPEHLARPGSLLSLIASGEHKTPWPWIHVPGPGSWKPFSSNNKCPYFDRNPKTFIEMLDCLRDGTPPSSRKVLLEAAFWMVDLKESKHKRVSLSPSPPSPPRLPSSSALSSYPLPPTPAPALIHARVTTSSTVDQETTTRLLDFIRSSIDEKRLRLIVEGTSDSDPQNNTNYEDHSTCEPSSEEEQAKKTIKKIEKKEKSVVSIGVYHLGDRPQNETEQEQAIEFYKNLSIGTLLLF